MRGKHAACTLAADCASSSGLELSSHQRRHDICTAVFCRWFVTLSAIRDRQRLATVQVNMRGQLDAAMKARHPTAPDVVQWHAGVLLPPDVPFGNGTWSPRHEWR